MLLFLEPFIRMLFYAMFVVVVSSLFLWPVAIAIFVLRLIVQIIILDLTQKRFNEKGLLGFSLIFDIFSPVINGLLYLSSFRIRPGKNTWK